MPDVCVGAVVARVSVAHPAPAVVHVWYVVRRSVRVQYAQCRIQYALCTKCMCPGLDLWIYYAQRDTGHMAMCPVSRRPSQGSLARLASQPREVARSTAEAKISEVAKNFRAQRNGHIVLVQYCKKAKPSDILLMSADMW